MKESRTLEWKESVTNTFLKTVSAFANYDGGQILFGITDNGHVWISKIKLMTVLHLSQTIHFVCRKKIKRYVL